MNTPQKDIIYVDVEDDITAIIGKLKAADHKIVALVPPKRVGVLQSAVNLRLLARAAEQSEKVLVIITSNQALSTLAAAAKIPIAKNLQSKPEMGEIAALDIDDGEEVIDGAQLPIGEHAKQAGVDDSDIVAASALGAAAIQKVATTDSASKKSPRVPNFDTFRKKFFLIGLAVVGVIAFLVWAIAFAPHARVILSTRTIDATVNQQVTLGASAETSATNETIKAERKTLSEEITIDFEATGEKEVGDKATGAVNFSTSSPTGRTVLAGTTLESSSGLSFVVASDVVIPAATLSFACGGICPGEAEGSVTAAEPGAKYNGASGELSGEPASVSAEFAAATSGGTDKTVPAVTKADIDKARGQIGKETDEDASKQKLNSQFGDGFTVLDESFTASTRDVNSNIADGGEAPSGKAQLTGEVVYTIFAVADSELSAYLEAAVALQLDDPETQKVYDTGADEATFSDVDAAGQGLSATLSATGAIGPKIDDEQVREIAAGKNYGEIQAALQGINGVESVDTKFSPFWVSRAPSDTTKISVEFKLNE